MSKGIFRAALTKLRGGDEVLERLKAKVGALLEYAQRELWEQKIPDGATAQTLVEALFEGERLGRIEVISGSPPGEVDDYVYGRGYRCYRRWGRSSSGGAYDVYVDVGGSPLVFYVVKVPPGGK